MPDELFHYTKAQTALEHILIDKTLKISQLQFTNDPKESKELYITALTGVIPPQLGESFKKIHKVIKNIKLKEWKVLCFSQNHVDLGSGKPSAEIISPFLSGKYRPAMWAHYASSPNRPHDGVCLKFNYHQLQNRISETFKGKGKYFVGNGSVEYNDLKFFQYLPFNVERIPELNELELEERVREYFLTNYKEIFLLKSKDWENEFEYRWLIHSQNDSPEYISIDGVLEEVFVGEEFSRECDSKLVALCAALNVPARRLRWFNGIPDDRAIFPA